MAKATHSDALLVELLTEELPPKSLAELGRAFEESIHEGLVLRRLLQSPERDSSKVLVSPRRLATIIPDVFSQAEDRSSEVTGPSVTAPPEAVAGFARKHGVSVEALAQADTPKGRVFAARTTIKGASLAAVLPEILGDAVKKLPVRKAMRWGSGNAVFARPVHGLVMMHGKRVIPGTLLDVESGDTTSGHRFMGPSRIRLSNARDYEPALLNK